MTGVQTCALPISASLAEAGEAGEDPRELGVFRHVGLHEKDGFIRVDAER